MASSVSAVKRELHPLSQESEESVQRHEARVATLVWDDGVGYKSRSRALRDTIRDATVCVMMGQP